MSTHILDRLVWFLAALAGLALSANASVILDGDFEVITGSGDRNSDYTFGAWVVGDPNGLGADGWSSGQSPFNDQIYTRANNSNRTGDAQATSGVDLVTFHGGRRGGGEVYQEFATTIGLTYAVTFDLREQSAGTQNFMARVFDGQLDITTGSSRSSIGMTGELGGLDIADVSGSTWATYSFDFTAMGTTSTIAFLSLDTEGSAGEVDLDTVSVTQVPEPSSLVVLSCFGVLMLVGRRRRA
jgi:hypothetical protein